eukprot:Skav228858  [mRNA]  locus=scaffold816:1523:6786:- [translate_table: standard]
MRSLHDLCIDERLILFAQIGGEGSSEDGGVMALYCVVFLVTGTLIGWNMVMNNKMFSDVVPSESFTYIYALDRAIEGTLGAFGQPAVGWLTDPCQAADQVFGFEASANAHECSPSDAYSLAQGVFTVAAVGFSLCFIFYSISHCTYPKDRRRVWIKDWSVDHDDPGPATVRTALNLAIEFIAIFRDVSMCRVCFFESELGGSMSRLPQGPDAAVGAQHVLELFSSDDERRRQAGQRVALGRPGATGRAQARSYQELLGDGWR